MSDVALTLEEALRELPPRPTLLWGRDLAGVASSSEPARYVAPDVLSVRGAPSGAEVAWIPAPGAETRLVLRLPRSKAELDLALAVARARLPEAGEVLLGGATREGIKSAADSLAGAVGEVEVLRTKRRCRVLIARRSSPPAPEPDLEAFVLRFDVPAGGAVLRVETVPGTFAHGRLDEGTARLLPLCLAALGISPVYRGSPPLCLAALGISPVYRGSPPLLLARRGPVRRVLDLGAGAGVLGGALAAADPAVEVDLVDAHAAAVVSARRTIAASGLDPARIRVHLAAVEDAPPGPYDLAVTNPPFHEGHEEDRGLALAFARAAARRLSPSGSLLLVANRHLPYGEGLRSLFRKVEVAFEDPLFRVFEASP